MVTLSALSWGSWPGGRRDAGDELVHGARPCGSVGSPRRGEHRFDVGREVRGDVVALAGRQAIGERRQDAAHYRLRHVRVDAGADGGLEKVAQRVGGRMDGSPGRWAGVAGRQADVEVRLDADDARQCGDRTFDLFGLRHARHLTMEQCNVVFDHHVDVGQVESLLQAAERGTDAVGQHIVAHFGIGVAATSRESIPRVVRQVA